MDGSSERPIMPIQPGSAVDEYDEYDYVFQLSRLATPIAQIKYRSNYIARIDLSSGIVSFNANNVPYEDVMCVMDKLQEVKKMFNTMPAAEFFARAVYVMPSPPRPPAPKTSGPIVFSSVPVPAPRAPTPLPLPMAIERSPGLMDGPPP